jgi:hypothetical protein
VALIGLALLAAGFLVAAYRSHADIAAQTARRRLRERVRAVHHNDPRT